MIRETLVVVVLIALGMIVSHSVDCVRSVREMQMDNAKSDMWCKRQDAINLSKGLKP